MKENLKSKKGITLIALVITIIILIILAGVSINLVFGQNGLINRAQSAGEQYNEATIREKVQMELTSIYMEKLKTNSPFTIEDALQELLDNGTFETIDTEAKSGTIGEYEIILKYDENGNIVIEEIGKITGTRTSYVLDPESYTKTAKVTIKFKATGEVKAVTKPDEAVVTASNGTVEIDYVVTANGTYVFKVENNDGTIKEKTVEVKTIDTLAPKDFTITAESTNTGIQVTANAEDAEETNTSVCSGIDRYEYYVKLSTEPAYTKYDTNLVEVTTGGTYSIYVIAYDKAGNSKQSATITVNKIQGPASNYGQGQKVNYTANGISDWKIFYKNEETNEVFIIASDYLPKEKIPTGAGMTITGTYQAYWASVPSDNATIADGVRNRFMMSWNKSTSNSNIKCVSKLLDTETWSTFATKKDSYAIGSPTLEMWVASWNDWYPNDPLACNTSNDYGYYINTGTNAGTTTNISLSAKEGYKNTLYYPHTSLHAGCYGYWLASPSAFSTNTLMYVYYGGIVSSSGYNNANYCVRPVVSLPSSLLTYDSATSSWNVN